MLLENDDFEFNGVGVGVLDIVIFLLEVVIKYSEFFLSVYIKWEFFEDILVCGVIWISFICFFFK